MFATNFRGLFDKKEPKGQDIEQKRQMLKEPKIYYPESY